MYGKGKQLMIKTLILHTLLKKDYTMYSIRKHIETIYSMYIRPSFGAIKPALVSLEKNEFIKSGKLMSDGGKLSIYYSITPKGNSFYYSIIADNTICEYSNLLTAIESLEKDNDRTRQ